MFKNCSNCCSDELGEAASYSGTMESNQWPRGSQSPTDATLDKTPHSRTRFSPNNSMVVEQRSDVINERVDRTRSVPIGEQVERQWVAVTAYQPIDTITREVEVPVVKTVETYVPKVTVEEKIIEVPKYIPEYVEKIVEVPEVKVVDKIVEIPQYQYQYKYVPKIETKENIIQRPQVEIKYIEKTVDVAQVKEVVRYEEVETVEEVIRYVPKGTSIPEEWKQMADTGVLEPAIDTAASRIPEPYPLVSTSVGSTQVYAPEPRAQGVSSPRTPPGSTTASSPPKPYPPQAYPHYGDASMGRPPSPRMEQVFRPKVVKTVEIQKHVPVSVDVPVPYMVPKPLVVPVQVPVLKFRDHFVPVPVRRRVIPRIKWTNEVYEVECIREKPFMQVQDIIKPVPCDVEIKVHEFVDKATPINPTELSQADIHAMWMRVNADLGEKRKEELGERYPYVKHPHGTVFGEPGCSQEKEERVSNMSDPEARSDTGGGECAGDDKAELDPIGLHPGHPLSMTYLQNSWIKKDTTQTHQIYTPEWFEAHQKALHGITMQYPTQVQLGAEQAAMFQPQQQAFGEAPWLSKDEDGLPMGGGIQRLPETRSRCCAPNPNAACCGPC